MLESLETEIVELPEVLAAVNSAVVCVIGLKTAQLGFIPANLFCIVLYAFNLRSWRKTDTA